MSEIIAKSKSAKRERVKEKEADDEQLDALDLTFKALADVRQPCMFLPRLSDHDLTCWSRVSVVFGKSGRCASR